MGLQYEATALGAYMGVHLTIQLFMLMMQGPYVFSGKEERGLGFIVIESRVFGAFPVVLLDGA
jgi:hypothetical protein